MVRDRRTRSGCCCVRNNLFRLVLRIELKDPRGAQSQRMFLSELRKNDVNSREYREYSIVRLIT